MASGQNDKRWTTLPPQHAGVKRTRAQYRQLPRKSVRLEALQEDEPAPVGSNNSKSSGRRERTQQQRKPVSRKRPRTQNDLASPEEATDERCKRRRKSAEEEGASIPALLGELCEDAEHPIAYWVANKRWPRQYFKEGKDMENILARKRSISTRSRKNSDTDSATPSSTDQGEPKSREQKSSEYKKPQYETVLATKGFSMKPSPRGVTTASKDWCKVLLEEEHEYPDDTLFRDDLFGSTCESIRNRNETRVIRDIALLIVPSAEIFTIRGATHLERLIDSVNEGWNNSISITKTRPQPDYSVGFRREAFTQEQLDRMHPIIGDFSDHDHSYFMATWYITPTGAAIAVRAVVELFRAVKREKELHREILAFFISHDHRSVRIYEYYAEINDAETKYYCHPIRDFSFVELDGREKWTTYKFTKNVYDNWMPKHFERICSAIDQIPADISFSVSQSEPSYPEQSSGLSQDFSAQSIAHSSAGSVSAQGQDESQSSIIQGLVATPSTSVTGREFKKPKRDTARRGRN